MCYRIAMPAPSHPIAPGRPRQELTPLQELRRMQRDAFARAIDPETPPGAAAQLMRAHVEMQRERDDLRMRPRPKPVDVQDRKRKPRSAPSTPAPWSDPSTSGPAPKTPS